MAGIEVGLGVMAVMLLVAVMTSALGGNGRRRDAGGGLAPFDGGGFDGNSSDGNSFDGGGNGGDGGGGGFGGGDGGGGGGV